MIDEIYQKERRYITNFDRDNIVCTQSPIFELQKFHQLKTTKLIEAPRDVEEQPITVIEVEGKEPAAYH